MDPIICFKLFSGWYRFVLEDIEYELCKYPGAALPLAVVSFQKQLF